ncbi:MAG TPA: hypothetical protein VGE40_00845 [Bacilli bacterium]
MINLGGVILILILNKGFIPVESIDDDETYRHGIFEWNITKLIQHIKHNKSEISTSVIDVSKYYSPDSFFSNINKVHAQTVDLSIPVIQAEINCDLYIVIDGHHRLFRAYSDGIKSVDSYKLRVDQHIPFFVSIKSYITFVEYWNSKLGQ